MMATPIMIQIPPEKIRIKIKPPSIRSRCWLWYMKTFRPNEYRRRVTAIMDEIRRRVHDDIMREFNRRYWL